jgi:6-phosphogluconolactonase
MKLICVDTDREALVAGSVDEASLFAAIRFTNIAREAIAHHGYFSVALSGGKTPLRVYELLSQPFLASRLDWSKVRLFWSDERAVPPESPDSNFHMAMQYFTKPPLDKAVPFRMPAESADLDKAAYFYEKLIQDNCCEGRLDLLLLGVGTDGHTASLFPNTAALAKSEKLVVPCIDYEHNIRRLTLALPCIYDTRYTLALVFGKEKAKILNEVFYGRLDPKQCPAKYIGRGRRSALFIITSDTTTLFPPSLARLK